MGEWAARDGWQKRDERRWERSHYGGGWSKGGEQGGSGSNSSMQGVSSNNWSASQPPAAPDPNPTVTPQYLNGHTAGYSQGYRDGFEDGAKRGHVEANRGYRQGFADGTKRGYAEAETAQSAAGSGTKKSRKVSYKGEGWKVWRETYTVFDEDNATEPYYYTRTGSTSTAVYPVEIQAKLHIAALMTRMQSEDVEYDMTDGWVYKIRLFSEVEKPHWNELLAKVATAEDGEVVGAQWDSTKATRDPGLGGFEEQVKYRPVFLRDVQPAR